MRALLFQLFVGGPFTLVYLCSGCGRRFLSVRFEPRLCVRCRLDEVARENEQ